jgi:hypothetical protein
MFKKCFVLSAFTTALMFAQVPSTTNFGGQPGTILSNGKLQIVVLTKGGSIASVVMSDDPEKLNPMWNTLGRGGDFNGINGHFVAVDGFGQSSAEERAAGLGQHGEGHTLEYKAKPERNGNISTLTLTGLMPIVQENFTRAYTVVDGENVVYVDSKLENLMGFDRPINWAEHATIQAPFVEPGKLTFYISGTRSQNRPYAAAATGGGRGGGTVRRIVSGADFTWPTSPGLDGNPVDMSVVPENPHYVDHTATLMDPVRRLEWVAALSSSRQSIYGYIFRREDYPWLQTWDNYPTVAGLVHGLEFGTQPYDLGRRIITDNGPLFGTPVWRWLPAKSTIESHFLLFYAHVPQGFTKVDSLELQNGQIAIEDRTARKKITLAASRGLQ